jgi:arylsulfatase A-like enzyme
MKMKQLFTVALLSAACGLAPAGGAAAMPRPDKPNVVLIMANDLDGQGYSPAPTCAPSRGAIMVGIGHAQDQTHKIVTDTNV